MSYTGRPCSGFLICTFSPPRLLVRTMRHNRNSGKPFPPLELRVPFFERAISLLDLSSPPPKRHVWCAFRVSPPVFLVHWGFSHSSGLQRAEGPFDVRKNCFFFSICFLLFRFFFWGSLVQCLPHVSNSTLPGRTGRFFLRLPPLHFKRNDRFFLLFGSFHSRGLAL